MKILLYKIAIIIGEILVKIWHSIRGIFLVGSEMSRQRRIDEMRDLHKHYKEALKSKMLKYLTKERIASKALMNSKVIFPRYRKNFVIGSYLTTVLGPSKPNDTVEDCLMRQYSRLHPYLMAYISIVERLREAAKDGWKEKDRKRLELDLKGLPCLLSRAMDVMGQHKKIALELQKAESLIREKINRDQDLEDINSIGKSLNAIDQSIAEKKKLKKSLEANLAQAKKVP